MGMDYYGLLAQANLESCNPADNACGARNAQKQAAVEDLWVNNYMRNPNGAPDDLKLSLGPVGSPEAVAAFDNNRILQPAVYVSSPSTPEPASSPAPVPPAPPARSGPEIARTGGIPSRIPASVAAVASNAAPQTIINSSGSSQPSPQLAVEKSSFFDSIPWWGWVAGGIGALMLFGDGRGR